VNAMRTLFGVAALGLLVVALNLAVMKEEPFDTTVLLLVGACLVCAVVWGVLRILTLAGSAAGGGGAAVLSTAAGVVAFLGICIALYAFAQHFDRSIDLTREGRRDLAPQTVRVLEGLSKEVNVYGLFVKRSDTTATIAKEKTLRFLEQCQEHTPFLNVTVIDPQEDLARKEALGVRQVSAMGTILIETEGAKREIHLSGRTARLEERDFTNALINLVRSARPKVGFLTGHGARSTMDTSPDGVAVFNAWLKEEAYETESIAIKLTDPFIPPDIKVVVIPGMAGMPYQPREIAALEEFVDRGGRMLVLLDPILLSNPSGASAEQLRPWLEQTFGIVVGNNVVGSTVTQRPHDLLLTPDISRHGILDALEEVPEDFDNCYSQEHPITRGFDMDMLLTLSRSVSLAPEMPEGTAGTEILRSLPGSWLETDLGAKVTMNRNPDEPLGSFPLAVAVSKKTNVRIADTGQTEEARVVVVGDVDFAANGAGQQGGGEQGLGVSVPGNINFLLNAMAWLTESPELIAIRARGEEDPAIILTKRDEQFIAWVATLGLFQVVIVAGVVVLLVRRRYS